MVDLDSNMSFGAPDLLQDSFEREGMGFRCHIEQTEDKLYDKATCLMPMPIEGMAD